MKKLLLIVGVVASTLTFGQSNDAGVIQAGLGWGMILGGATIETTIKGPYGSNGGDTTYTTTDDGVGANVNYGVRGQYGLSEKFSVGLYIRKEGAAYVATRTETVNTGYGSYTESFSSTMTVSGFGFGIEPKFYIVNNDKFNFNVAPSIGYTTGSATLSNSYVTEPGKASGLAYGVDLGINWFFSDVVGMYADLGYAGSSLSGTFDDAALKDVTFDVSNGGFFIGMGLSLKFGG